MTPETNSLFKQVSRLNQQLDNIETWVELYNSMTSCLFKTIPALPPVCNVRLLPVNLIESNSYNPNKMARPEGKLLKQSIVIDGLTMPIIVNQLGQAESYILIDGFHRFELLKSHPELQPIPGYIPCVVFHKSIENSMSTSVRHNIARGVHQVELTSSLVITLRQLEWSNERICKELGMDNDEVLRMQQVSGLAAEFKDQKFSKSWE
ncbi:IbrB-like domain-containing protein [Vibrio neptunius]|uniref:IbrB-like domain-containing protein n=1 Tax=Vibrio neptunius TaxID=170651 RepID=UPI0019D0ADDB|nr:ParB/RepB/Spo0J family partition protein [Vibrio neptunius]MBN3571723.1 ParB N-terminal domain-containing protein [Vibrio neptunius]QXX05500.1 ParB N-terminal domain-containing protein [Vibrio neptunius]